MISRYGSIKFGQKDIVEKFQEKPDGDGSWINGGFFVLNPRVLDLIENDQIAWEDEPLNNLVKNNQLYAFRHEGFWHPLDTLSEKILLNELWNKGNAPWKLWK